MQSDVKESDPTKVATVQGSRVTRWAGWILSGLPVVFLLMDGVVKILNLQPVIDTSVQLGLPVELAPGIGILLLACLVIYVVPQTAVLGAVLLTGYLGGAIALQLRIGAPLFSLLFPVLLGAMFWGGLYLRIPILRTLLPLRR